MTNSAWWCSGMFYYCTVWPNPEKPVFDFETVYYVYCSVYCEKNGGLSGSIL